MNLSPRLHEHYHQKPTTKQQQLKQNKNNTNKITKKVKSSENNPSKQYFFAESFFYLFLFAFRYICMHWNLFRIRIVFSSVTLITTRWTCSINTFLKTNPFSNNI